MSITKSMATASLFAIGLGASSLGLVAASSGALADTASSPAPAVVSATAPACAKSDVIIVSRDADLTTVSVRLGSKSKTVSCDVSLHSYATEGATWATSGTQTVVGFATIHLTPTAQTLSVQGSACFGQNELVLGTKKYDGSDGALPHFPNGVFGKSATLATWSGGAACPPATGGTNPPANTPTVPAVTPTVVTPTVVAPTAVLGEVLVAPKAAAPAAVLPFTGAPIATEFAAGAILLGLGALLIGASRLRDEDAL
jgi:hypothetical protein